MKYARLSAENIVIETFIPHGGFSLEECFHPTIAQQFEIVDDSVEQNWIKQQDGTFISNIPLVTE